MDTWDILSPDYITDFFAIWYTEWWVQAVMIFFLGLPLLLFALVCFTKFLDRQKPPNTENNNNDNQKNQTPAIWHGAKENWLLILVHRSDKVCQERGTCWIWIVVGLIILSVNTSYGCFYFKLSVNPNIITTHTLQTLNYLDFEIARQFLYRYIALGWTLMLVSLAFCMLFLEKGLLTIKHVSRPILKVSRPNPQRNLCIVDSRKNNKTWYVNEEGLDDTQEGDEDARGPVWITFKYYGTREKHEEDQLALPSGWYVTVEDSEANVYMDEKKLKPNRPYNLKQLHWLEWEYRSAGTQENSQVTLQVVVQ